MKVQNNEGRGLNLLLKRNSCEAGEVDTEFETVLDGI
jgi:hypothetical protein